MNIHSLRFRLTAWYAGLLMGALLLFGVSVYLGLERYLEWMLQDTLSSEGRTIGTKLLSQFPEPAERYWITGSFTLEMELCLTDGVLRLFSTDTRSVFKA